jgi:hypothetical protein
MTPDESRPIPLVLAAAFDVEDLLRESSTIVLIEPTGTITWMNPAWFRFARANGGHGVIERFDVGSSYFDGISPPLRGFYESVVSNAHCTQEVFEQEYECSSPDRQRLIRMRALPLRSSGLLLEHTVARDVAHEAASAEPLESQYRDDRGLVLQCSNCRRVRRSDGATWDWVRPWVAAPLSNTTHGLCRTCLDFYWGVRLRRRP